jgi:hypothetical protein
MAEASAVLEQEVEVMVLLLWLLWLLWLWLLWLVCRHRFYGPIFFVGFIFSKKAQCLHVLELPRISSFFFGEHFVLDEVSV